MDEIRQKNIQKELFKVIENQIKADNPKETKRTFDRLRGAGYSRQETMKLLACVVLCEMNEMLKVGRVFNEEIYIKALKALPQVPWDALPEEYPT